MKSRIQIKLNKIGIAIASNLLSYKCLGEGLLGYFNKRRLLLDKDFSSKKEIVTQQTQIDTQSTEIVTQEKEIVTRQKEIASQQEEIVADQKEIVSQQSESVN